MSVPATPDMACILGLVTKYGENQKKHPVNTQQKWGFYRASDKDYQFSATSSEVPPGYIELEGLTHSFKGTPDASSKDYTDLFRAAYMAHGSRWTLPYIDPVTRQPDTAHGPWTATEWTLLVTEHELAHQNGLGDTKEDEKLGNGYGVEAVQTYRKDPNAKACGSR